MKKYLITALSLVLLMSAPACHRPRKKTRPPKHTSKEIDVKSMEMLLDEQCDECATELDIEPPEDDLLVLDDTEDDLFDNQEPDLKEL